MRRKNSSSRYLLIPITLCFSVGIGASIVDPESYCDDALRNSVLFLEKEQKFSAETMIEELPSQKSYYDRCYVFTTVDVYQVHLDPENPIFYVLRTGQVEPYLTMHGPFQNTESR